MPKTIPNNAFKVNKGASSLKKHGNRAFLRPKSASWVNESNEELKIDISKFADDNKEGAYWKYSTGALGQYYVASLRQIGLVKEMITDGKLFYMVTDNDRNISGKELALAFEENLKPFRYWKQLISNPIPSRDRI